VAGFVLVAIAGLTGCSGGSAGSPPITAPPAVTPSTVRASVPPPGTADHEVTATATITMSDGTKVKLRSKPVVPPDIFAEPSGKIAIQLVTFGPHSESFNLSGGVRTGGPVTNDRVSGSLPNGVYIDTTDPSAARCTATYSIVTVKQVTGTATCRVFQPFPAGLTAHFSLGGG
jgi:hypothetical protein